MSASEEELEEAEAEVKANEVKKKNASVEEGKERKTDGRWRQLLLFPEGTCTNGQALIHFKVT